MMKMISVSIREGSGFEVQGSAAEGSRRLAAPEPRTLNPAN
jgi:hypothetical protein